MGCMDTQELNAVALICTLTPSPAPSSSELLAQQVLDELAVHNVSGSVVRVVDHDVRPGVKADMGSGDEWPAIREKILAADILVLATPIWLGHTASVAQRVLERLDAELAGTDDAGRPIMFDKVAIAGVVGNEDGAHHVIAELFQGLNDIGFSIAGQSGTYWVGEAMHGTDFKDLDKVPDPIAKTTATAARNAAHLAKVLKRNAYPAG